MIIKYYNIAINKKSEKMKNISMHDILFVKLKIKILKI